MIRDFLGMLSASYDLLLSTHIICSMLLRLPLPSWERDFVTVSLWAVTISPSPGHCTLHLLLMCIVSSLIRWPAALQCRQEIMDRVNRSRNFDTISRLHWSATSCNWRDFLHKHLSLHYMVSETVYWSFFFFWTSVYWSFDNRDWWSVREKDADMNHCLKSLLFRDSLTMFSLVKNQLIVERLRLHSIVALGWTGIKKVLIHGSIVSHYLSYQGTICRHHELYRTTNAKPMPGRK